MTQVKDILDRLGSSPHIPSDQKQTIIRDFIQATRAALKEADAVSAKEESNVEKSAVESSQDSPPATDKSSNSVTATAPSASAFTTGNSTPNATTTPGAEINTKKRPADDDMVVVTPSASTKKPRKKPTPSPKTMYNRVKAKLEAGHTSKKYQSHYGSKDHAPDVYRLMLQLLKEHAVPLLLVENDKKQVRRALDMGTSVFQAFEGYCQELISPGYEPDVLREAIDEFTKILQVAVASNVLNDPSEMDKLMTMLEVIDASIDGMGRRMKEDACVYYTTGDGKEDDWAPEEYQGKRYQAGENVLHQAIRTFQPDYDPSQRPPQMPKVSASTLGFLRGMILSK